MNALYAFNRITDDLGDDESLTIEERRLRLAQWRELVRGAMSGSSSDVIDSAGLLDEERRYLPAISDMLARASIPHEYLFAVIDGVESDLHPMEVATFEELERYCYQVAGAVGLCCIHVWGFREGPKVRQLAIDCGLALQLTNIARDTREDADHRRRYIPATWLPVPTPSIRGAQEVVHQAALRCLGLAEPYYASGIAGLVYLPSESRRGILIAARVYREIGEELRRRGPHRTEDRVIVPAWRKATLVAGALLGRTAWSDEKPMHDISLHRELDGLVGARR